MLDIEKAFKAWLFNHISTKPEWGFDYEQLRLLETVFMAGWQAKQTSIAA
jgi:hypothetical protein